MENNKSERVSKASQEYQLRQKKNKTLRIVAIVAAVVIVIGLVVASFFTSGTWARTRTAATVGDHKISCAEFNYYYQTAVNTAYQELRNTYGDSASYILDLSKPLDEQELSEGVTWDDRIKESTLASLKEVYALSDAANAEGFVLSDEDIASVTVSNAYLETTAAQYGLTVNQYLTAVYGKGMNTKLYADCLFRSSTASGYYNAISEGFTYTQDQIDAYYGEHINDFDTMNMRIFPISYTDETGSKDTAEATANEMLEQITDEESFAALAYQYAQDTDKEVYSDNTATYHAAVPASNLTCEGMLDWFYDEARVEGDKNVFSDESGYYVVMFISREDNNYNELALRHVLVSFSTDEEGNVSEESNAAAKELIQQYFDEFEATDKSEDAFAEIAKAYSSDSSAENGGYIDGVYKGALEDSFDKWMFDESRQVGDYDMLETSYGWHLVYFCGETDVNYLNVLVEDTLKTNDVNAWYDSIVGAYEVTANETVLASDMIG